MSVKWFRVYGATVVVAMLALISWSIATGNAVVPVPTVIAGVLLLYLLRKQVTDVVADERDHRISEKASRFTIRIFTLVTAISGIALTAVSTGDSPPYREIGLTLAFCACGLLILYMISYTYHSRKN